MKEDAPENHFERLLEGYRRFRSKSWDAHPEHWRSLNEGQSPKIMIIACSDSRVDPAQIFDTGAGEVFVVRNVAAMVPPFETTPGNHGVSAALEFAVQVLKVQEVVVIGHGRCGGCKAALTQELHGTQPGEGGFIANWIALLDEARKPVVEAHGDHGPEAELAMELAGVKASLKNLRTFPCIQRKEASGDIKVRGVFFPISDGILHLLDEETGEFAPVI